MKQCDTEHVSCKELILEKLFEYEEGTMSEKDRLHLQHHIEECPPCVRFLSTYQTTGRTLRMLKPRDIPPALAKTVMAFVRSRGKKP